ncbi:MAG: sigma-70 family RNA polymerase sigma factor [Chitinophagaceae bacterium]
MDTKKRTSMEVIRNFPDEEIVANLRSGLRMDDTIKVLYRNYFEGLSRYIIHNSGSAQDAEDIFQEVVVNFIDLVQRDKFRGESSIKTFLFSMNRNTWLNELKRKGRAAVREEKYVRMETKDEAGQEPVDANAARAVEDREEKAAIASIVASLGETCRKILTLFYYENLPMKEILEATEYDNEQVVRNKKYKCLKQLEQMLNEKPQLKQTLKNLLHG